MKNRLEEIRKGKDINQEELANGLNLSRQTISSLGIEDIFIYEEDIDN